jgi:D-alanine-D-alanine ligase
MRQKVGIIFGGKSGEYEVSLKSAYNVIHAIDKDRYDVSLFGITREGVWKRYDGPADHIPNDAWLSAAEDMRLEALDAADILFPVLHGTFGEDGTIQGLFEMLGKAYVGCGVMSSSVCMDKVISKYICQACGIPVTDYVAFGRDEYSVQPEKSFCDLFLSLHGRCSSNLRIWARASAFQKRPMKRRLKRLLPKR